jgi:hypothetical protein
MQSNQNHETLLAQTNEHIPKCECKSLGTSKMVLKRGERLKVLHYRTPRLMIKLWWRRQRGAGEWVLGWKHGICNPGQSCAYRANLTRAQYSLKCLCYVLVSRVLAFIGQRIGSWGSWMISQSQYIKWDLLERKERLHLGNCSRAWKPVACCTGEGWGFYGGFNSGLGGFFSLALRIKGFLRWTGLVSTFIGGGEHFAHQPCGRCVSLL